MPIKLPLIASSLPAAMAQKKQAESMAQAMEDQARQQAIGQRNAWLSQQQAISQQSPAVTSQGAGQPMGQIGIQPTQSSPQIASLQSSPSMSQAASTAPSLPQFAAVNGARPGMAQAIGGLGQPQTLGGDFPRIGGIGQGRLIGDEMARIGANGQARGFTAPNTELGLFANEPAKPGVGVPRPAGDILQALGQGDAPDAQPQAELPQSVRSPFPAYGNGVELPLTQGRGSIPPAVTSFESNFPGMLGQLTGNGPLQGPGINGVDITPQQSMVGRIGGAISSMLPGGLGDSMRGAGLSPSNFDNQLGDLLSARPGIADSFRGPLASHLSAQMQTPGQQQSMLGQLGQNPNTMGLLGMAPNLAPGTGPNLLSFGQATLPGVGQVGMGSLPGVTMPGMMGGLPNIGAGLPLPIGGGRGGLPGMGPTGAMPAAPPAGAGALPGMGGLFGGFGGMMGGQGGIAGAVAAGAMAGAAAAAAAAGGGAPAGGGFGGGSSGGGGASGGEGGGDSSDSGGGGGGGGGGGK